MAPKPSPAQPVLADPGNPERFYVLGLGGNVIRMDLVKEVYDDHLRAFSTDSGYFDVPASFLHESTRRHYQMGEFAQPMDAETAERQSRIAQMQEVNRRNAEAARSVADARQAQIAADNALAAKQQREQAEAQRARDAVAAANSPMAVYQRALARQPKPAPVTEITVNSPGLDAISEQMRLDRVRQQVQQARKEGRAYYVSPADARALGF